MINSNFFARFLNDGQVRLHPDDAGDFTQYLIWREIPFTVTYDFDHEDDVIITDTRDDGK